MRGVWRLGTWWWRGVRGLVVWACLGALVAGTSLTARTVAAAESTDPAVLRRAEAIATEAKLLFQQKEYAQAAERFMEAYTLARRPALIYNAARAYEEAGNVEKAAALFRAYRDLPDAPADGKVDAAARITRLEAILGQRKAEAQARLQEEKARQDQAAREREDKARLEREQEARRQEAERKERDAKDADRRDADRRALERKEADRNVPEPGGGVVMPAPRPFPWLAAGSTAGLAAVGAGLYALALADAADARAMEGDLTSDTQADAYLAKVDGARNLRAAAIVAGVAAVGCGGWLAWELTRPAPGKPSSVVVLPGPAGLLAVARF